MRRLDRFIDLAKRVSPSGRILAEDVWRSRHRGLLIVLWAHAPALFAYSLARGYSPFHSLLDVMIVGACASVATLLPRLGRGRRLCSAAVALGLLTASALVVHLAGGVIEAHFHFFVIMALLLLYEDWIVFLLAFGYVGVHHGVLGQFAPSSVFNHPDAIANPWKWALIHALFVAAASLANITTWRLNEDIRIEARLAKDRAEQNEQLFRNAFEEAPIGVGIADLDGRWQKVNAALCALVGKEEHELVGTYLHETVPSDVAAAEAPRFRELISGAVPSFQLETRLVGPDDQDLWALVTVSLARDENGRPTSLICHGQSIAELKAAESSLRQTERRYRTLVEHLPLTVYIDNLDDRSSNVYTSPQIEEMLGYTVDEWTSNPDMFVETLHPDDRERVLAEIVTTHASGSPFTSEYRLIAKDGREVWVRDHGVEVHGDDSEGAVAQGYLLDITHEKAREAQARRSQKMEAVGQLAGGIAHDFNNLLTVILGYCSLALERAAAGEHVEHEIEQVSQAAASASALTAQLLAFSRRENFQTERLLADESIAATESLLRRVIGEHVQLDTRLDAPDATIEIDRGGLEQVLVNLVVNARDAVGERGRITITTGSHDLDVVHAHELGLTPGPYVVLKVADDGCGIDEETQARIFEPFFTTKAVGEGTGLGLSTVYAIVRRSGGGIVISSSLDTGTTVEVWLPQRGAVAPPATVAEPAAPTERGDERILLVEDEQVVRDLVTEVLEHHGYGVTVAESANDAVAQCEAGLSFDLLVTDVVMPDMNGWDLAEALTAYRPDLRVVYMSGYADDVIPPNGLRETERFLQKPFALSALATIVREALDAAGVRQAA